MIVAVFFVIVMIALIGWSSSMYLWQQGRLRRPSTWQWALMSLSFLSAAGLSVVTWWWSMRSGVKALRDADRTRS